jgi:hypothetical protein
MRKTCWSFVSLVATLGLALAACSGPARGSGTQPSSASNYFIEVTASPNTIRGATAGTDEEQGGCSTVQTKVYDTQGRLVDGALITITTTLGRFPQTAARPESVGVSGTTIRGVYTDVVCAKAERGTAIVTATVEDAHASVQITIF